MLLWQENGGANKVVEAVKVSKVVKMSETVRVVKIVGVRQLGHKRGKMPGKWLIPRKSK